VKPISPPSQCYNVGHACAPMWPLQVVSHTTSLLSTRWLLQMTDPQVWAVADTTEDTWEQLDKCQLVLCQGCFFLAP
jgi:hypothetical protein